AQALHDPRRRPMVGHRDPADDQVPEPTTHDVGMVTQAASRQPAALHADSRIKQGDVRLGLAGAQDAPRRSRGPCAGSACRRTRQLSLQQRKRILLRRRPGAVMDRYELRRLDYSLTEDHEALQAAYKDFLKTPCS